MKAPMLHARARKIREARRNIEDLKSFEVEIEEPDIYSVNGVEQLLENDDITPEEAAFMEGYDEDE